MMMGGDGAAGGGNTNQFIGSKISLISKSEIRYEGILYSLDLEEATISLQKVRSFGTEDRPTTRPVAPKDEVYEFIIFRGSDIKGIDVLEPPPQGKEPEEPEPIDPAIVEVQHYQPQQPVQVQAQQPPQQQNVIGIVDQRPFGGNGFGGPGVGVPPPHHINPGQQMHNNGFSIGVGFGGPMDHGRNIGIPQQQVVAAPIVPVSPEDEQDPNSPNSPDKRNTSGSSNPRRSYAPRGRGGGSNDTVPTRGGVQSQGGARGGQVYGQGGRGGPGQSQGQGRGGYYQNRGFVNGEGRGQGPRKFYRRGELKGNKKITFDGEFDFEKANEELQKALMKIKIADGGDEEDEEEEVKVEEELDKENERKEFYQKDNFFDNISCEALERKSGKRERPDWRAERKLNAETFGLTGNGRGGPRGGGSTYYGRGGGGGYHHNYYNNYGGGRGGYGGYGQGRGQYRGGGGYRGSRGYGGGGGRGGSRGGSNSNERVVKQEQ